MEDTLAKARLRATLRRVCMCKGQCGMKHSRRGCSWGRFPGTDVLILLGDKQFCEHCAKRIKLKELA